MNAEQAFTQDQMSVLGELITQSSQMTAETVLGAINQKALKKEKQLSELAALKKERDDKIKEIRKAADEEIKALHEGYAPRIERLAEEAQEETDDKVESHAKKFGKIIGIGFRPVQAAVAGIKDGATR